MHSSIKYRTKVAFGLCLIDFAAAVIWLKTILAMHFSIVLHVISPFDSDSLCFAITTSSPKITPFRPS